MHKFLSLFLLLNIRTIKGQGDALVQPSIFDSSDGVLDTTLTIEYASFSGPHYTFTNSRLLNGTLPGPTLRLNAGDKLRILFKNELELQAGAVTGQDNEYTDPDDSNLHFHGGHVSGELPSDDIRMHVVPGDEYQYETDFPENHMPGTHWIHPHVHGSSALQLGGGAAMALIVKDPDDYLPNQVAEAEEYLMLIQNIRNNNLNTVISAIGDSKLSTSFSGGPRNFRLVNGQYQPTITAQPGEWMRWRIIWGNWFNEHLNLSFNGATECEMQLLAKDGIYIQDYPRTLQTVPIPTGGRADIMVRCSAAGSFDVVDFDSLTVLTVIVTGDTVSSTDLEAWTPSYPEYLTDLTSTSSTNGCDCQTSIRGCDDSDKFCINDVLFDKSVYLHTIEFGSVVEREIRGVGGHPYHQHVYPFQLVDGLSLTDDEGQATYFQIGDWHDVIAMDLDSGGVTIRYVADVHQGVLMLHCHILTHEDLGTMAQELIMDSGSCQCDALYEEPGESCSLFHYRC